MTIEQTPILRDADAEKNAYRGFAMAQMRILKDYMNVSGLNSYSRVVTLANGVVITCQKSFNREDIFISVPTVDVFTDVIESEVFVGFIFNPRVFGRNDGYRVIAGELCEYGDGDLEYPLQDDDKLSASIDPGADKLVVVRTPQEYGNVDWIGVNTSTEAGKNNAPVLTWKGPTGRSIQFDFSKHISGLTSSDVKFSDDSPDYYTCFGPNVYSGGSVLFSAPAVGDIQPKVLGCAVSYYENSENVKVRVYVCVVNNHYADKLGFFDEVWINHGASGLYNKDSNPAGWEKIYEQAAGRPTECWFFNSSGTKTTKGVLELSIDFAVKEVEQIIHDSGSGDFTATRTGDRATITHSGSYRIYSDYKGDLRVTANLIVADSVARTITNTIERYVSNIEIYTPGVIEEFSAVIVGPDIYTPGAYTVQGSWGSCCVGGDSVTVWPTGCGTGTISVSQCGITITKQVRMPEGSWVLVREETATCTGTYGPTSYTPCASTPCQYLAIPADVGCGYSWLSWDNISDEDKTQFLTKEDVDLNGGYTETWGWAAKSDTVSSLGVATSSYNGQRWVCLSKRYYEWWCTPTTKGW